MFWSGQSYLEALLAHSKINLFKATANNCQDWSTLYLKNTLWPQAKHYQPYLQLYIDHKPFPATMQLQHTITYYISGSCGMFIYYSAKDNIFIHGASSGLPQ